MWYACSDLIFICWHEHWLLLCTSFWVFFVDRLCQLLSFSSSQQQWSQILDSFISSPSCSDSFYNLSNQCALHKDSSEYPFHHAAAVFFLKSFNSFFKLRCQRPAAACLPCLDWCLWVQMSSSSKFSHFVIKSSRLIMKENNTKTEICQK